MALKLAAFDMDGTLTSEPSSWEFIHRRMGLWDGKADAYMKMFLSGSLTYEEFSQLDAGEWKGRKEEDILSLLDLIGYAPCAREIVSVSRRLGAKTALISSGLSLLAARVGSDLGIDYVYANELAVADGVMTGRVNINVSIDDPAKKKGALLRNLMNKLGASAEETCAIGDNWGDIEMLREAGLAILINPSLECVNKACQDGAPHVVCASDLCDAISVIEAAYASA